MSKLLQWVIGVSVVLITAAVIVSVAWPMLTAGLGWGAGYGMMGAGPARMQMMGRLGDYGMMGGQQGYMPMMGQAGRTGMLGGMMNGFGMPFSGIGLLPWLLVLAALVVAGAVWITRQHQASSGPLPIAVHTDCPHCGRPVQAGWKACPACGEKI